MMNEEQILDPWRIVQMMDEKYMLVPHVPCSVEGEQIVDPQMA